MAILQHDHVLKLTAEACDFEEEKKSQKVWSQKLFCGKLFQSLDIKMKAKDSALIDPYTKQKFSPVKNVLKKCSTHGYTLLHNSHTYIK